MVPITVDPTDSDAATSGDAVLDEMLAGGLPAERATLAIGGPGTGKSTLAMQFLQAGLERGDRCLFISTEQTPEELRSSFDDFAFDLGHDNLTITSVHAVTGRTLDADEELTIRTLDGGELVDMGIGIPFNSQYLRQTLDQYGPVDRVVLDSASGLAALSDEEAVFRRAVLDLIRLFTDDFNATSLIVAEGRPGDPDSLAGHEALQFATHGVIRLWQERQSGSTYRYLRIEKMRGVNHDTRRYTVNITEDGVNIVPRRRTRPATLTTRESFSTGIGGLDELLGGGFIHGTSPLILHDGRADVHTLMTQIMASAIRQDWITGLTLPADLSVERLNDFWTQEPFTAEQALDNGQLIIEEWVRNPPDHHENVHVFEESEDMDDYLQKLFQKVNGEPYLAVVDLEPVLQRMDPEMIMQGRYRVQAELMDDAHIVLFVLNPETVDEKFTSFFVDSSATVLRHHQDDGGLEYIQLDKSPMGAPGTGRIVEYIDESPFVRLA